MQFIKDIENLVDDNISLFVSKYLHMGLLKKGLSVLFFFLSFFGFIVIELKFIS